MNILFFFTGEPTPIFETLLELIQTHIDKGDKIRLIACDGKPVNCFWNPEKKEYICKMCRSKFKSGLNSIKNNKNIELHYFNGLNDLNTNYSFEDIVSLKNFKYDDLKIGMGVASRLISYYRDHRFDTLKYYHQINLEIKSTLEIYKNLKIHINEFKPNRFYVFNGRASAYLAATEYAKKVNLIYFTYEVATTYNKYLLRENSTSHSILEHQKEMDMLWEHEKNIQKKESISKTYFEKKRFGKSISKLEKFTEDQKIGLLPYNFDKNNFINIAIFNSTIDEYAAIDGWENEIYFPDETAGIKKILENFKTEEKYKFYLRVHPNMRRLPKTTSQLKDIADLDKEYPNLIVIWPEDKVDSYELLISCHKVVTFSSTIGIESAYWGKPTILAGHALYENLDCFHKPKNHEEVINLIKSEHLLPFNNYSSLKYAYREVKHGINFLYFKETGVKNNNAIGKFNGTTIKPKYIYILNLYFNLLLNKFNKILNNFY